MPFEALPGARVADQRRDSLSGMLEQGTEAPDFELPDQDGTPVKLSDLRGQTVVLYFYPKADTPGCTTQACGIRDHHNDYADAGVTVLGVSPDSVKDADHAVAEQYGVWAEKSMYGRTYWGNLRATFIIDGDGNVARVFPKVSPKTHDDVVLDALKELAAA
jgi:peroxiredoxin Q/BCP